jgi:hypothetical protein
MKILTTTIPVDIQEQLRYSEGLFVTIENHPVFIEEIGSEYRYLIGVNQKTSVTGIHFRQ